MILLFLLFFALILCFPTQSLAYAANGLQLWFRCMVPALFPFMVLSGLLVRQGLAAKLVGSLSPPICRLYKISPNGVYCMVVGFLCGFPMGARTVSEFYERGELSKREAEMLLAFCNNIGPVYYISFLLPTIGLTKGRLPYYLFGMYGIPLCYGLILRYSGFLLPREETAGRPMTAPASESIFLSLDQAMQSAINGITSLGGYMMLFSMCNLLPEAISILLKYPLPHILRGSLACLFEITTGVGNLGDSAPVFVLTLLPLGGLSCIAQTRSMLKNTGLSLGHYLLHKGMQTLLTAGYYLLYLFFLL